jgi:hypothetical protein
MADDQILFDTSRFARQADTAVASAWTVGSSRPGKIAALQALVSRYVSSKDLSASELAFCSANRVFLDADLNRLVASQRNFWRLFDDLAKPDALHVDLKPSTLFDLKNGIERSAIVDGQHRSLAIRYLSKNERYGILELIVSGLSEIDILDSDCFAEFFDDKILPEIQSRVIYRRIEGPAAFATPPSTREWVLGFMLWTGCPPPSAGIVRVFSSAKIIPVHDGGKIDQSNLRPSGRPSTKAWPYCRLTAPRRRQYSAQSRFAYGHAVMDRRAFHVRRPYSPRRIGLEDSGRSALVAPF